MQKILLLIACASSFCGRGFCSPAAGPWRLQTGDTVIEISVVAGAPVISRISSAKDGEDWLLAPVVESLLPAVTQNGSTSPTKWRYESGEYDSTSGKLTMKFVNAAPAMELESI